ncbi:hypothetical protein HZC08_01405 [Candidatus Micrarchaeota archaeon]|nr:hypothetical protein [Candidatus Micrarchaeota archaeon]
MSIPKSENAEKSLLIEFLGDTPFVRVLDFLIQNSIFDYVKSDISESAGISRASLYKIWPTLEKYQIIKETRKIGNTTLYKLNKKNPVVQKLIELDFKISKEFAESLTAKQVMVSRS